MKTRERKAVMGKTVGFRCPDQNFCDMFNYALDATGWSLNDLCVEAIREGIAASVNKRLVELQRARKYFAVPGKPSVSTERKSLQ